MREVKFHSIVRGGRLSESVRQNIARMIHTMEGKPVEITIKPRKKQRSVPQNAFYWGVVVPLVHEMMTAAGNVIGHDEVHEFLKAHVGGLNVMVADGDGVRRTVTRSSTRLSTVEWEDYLEKIRAWAAQWGVVVPFPNEQNGGDKNENQQ